jgi:hypothetical protein
LRERLLHHEAKEDDVAQFTKVVKQLGTGVRILDNVLKGGLEEKRFCYRVAHIELRLQFGGDGS